MKIESSDVQMSTQSSSHFEMNTTSQFTFKQQMAGVMSANQPSESLQNNLDYLEKTFEIQPNQGFLHPIHEMTKVILEQILQRFLQGKKAVELYPKAFDCMENTFNEKPQQSLQFVVKQNIKIEKTLQYEKQDSIAFHTNAIIKTKDKEININLDCSYTKAFFEEHKETLAFEETRFLDPLVIQYDGKSSAFDSLSSTMSFKFDLKNNETLLDLPLLKKGNGFLVLDKDANGLIDNGNELFGPNTNNGFEELRAYDSDNNNWIDENDSIFKDLLIWSKDESGEDTLIGLGQSGIGALYLNEVKSNFTYNKSINESMARLKSSSIFLREDGTAGMLSSLDFIA